MRVGGVFAPKFPRKAPFCGCNLQVEQRIKRLFQLVVLRPINLSRARECGIQHQFVQAHDVRNGVVGRESHRLSGHHRQHIARVTDRRTLLIVQEPGVGVAVIGP